MSDLEAADTRSEGGSVPFDVRDSTPNSAGPQGAAGDMGVSSERTGPDSGPDNGPDSGSGSGDEPGHGITGTGTTGDARTRTDGTFDSSPHQWDAPDLALGDAPGDAGAGARTTGGLSGRPDTTGRADRDEEQRYVEGVDTADQGPVRTEGREGVDRTVGEPNTMPLGGDKPHDSGRDNPL